MGQLQDITLTATTTISRRERKRNKKLKPIVQEIQRKILEIKKISPKTTNQHKIFKSYQDNNNLFIHGMAGTGKTFLSLYLSLQEVLETENYKKVIIVRSVVPTRDMGFLPGNKKEKMKEYEAPYSSICNELFGRGDSYELLKSKNLLEFIPTSFIRGITLNDSIVIVDEAQNLSGHECDSVITRIGHDSKMIFCGDFRQSDLRFKDEKQGFIDFMEIIHNMSRFDSIEMFEQDIVRSPLVKEYIVMKNKLGLLV